MDYLGLVKHVVGLVVSYGAGTIVKNIIEHTTPSTVSTLKRVAISVGGLVMSAMVASEVTKFADKKIDEMSEKFIVVDETE